MSNNSSTWGAAETEALETTIRNLIALGRNVRVFGEHQAAEAYAFADSGPDAWGRLPVPIIATAA